MKEPLDQIAKVVSIDADELRELARAGQIETIAVNRDPFWSELHAYVGERIGELISIREEIGRKLARDRKQQVARRVATVCRGKVPGVN